MGRELSRRGVLLGGGGLALLAGCDLIEFAKNPVLNFQLPPRSYKLSTQDPNWKKPPAFFNQPISCTSAASCCPPPGTPPGVQIPECMQVPIVCQSNVCGVEFPLETYQTINLSMDAPALATSAGSAFEEITLQSLTFKITNDVGVEFPPVKLYIAPESVKSAQGMAAGVQDIGETPRAPAGMVTMETRDTPDEARKAFAALAKDFRKPFNFIALTNVSLLSGLLPKEGDVTIEVTGSISARL
ncbi:MAG TPA: hypothetical protein VGF45_19945 [Polyangia bacterium]